MDKATIEKINSSVDLIEYVSQYLPLIKRGKDYFCSCPLHEDKTPSLSFNSEKNLFYCFSCGRGGGIINYLVEYEGCSFDEAIEKALKISGLDCSAMCQSKTISFLKTIQNDKDIEITSHKILDKKIYECYNKEPIELWQKEGISQEIMDLFEIRVDKRANRIVYPVYDMKGNFINIKGRTMYANYKELGIPKYINYYPVGTMDYFQGYNISKNFINNDVIIFEGIKSVMKAFEWGYKNCISAEKHTLTKEQIDALISLQCDIIFAYDKDVDYESKDVKMALDKLKKVCNVYIIKDTNFLDEKDSPVDKGKEIWEILYNNKRKI